MTVLQGLVLLPPQEDRELDFRAWSLSVCCLNVHPIHPAWIPPSTLALKDMHHKADWEL